MWKFYVPAVLKPDTPWRMRRYIRKKERSVDRLYGWKYRICVLMEIVVIVLLLMCIMHYHIKFA